MRHDTISLLKQQNPLDKTNKLPNLSSLKMHKVRTRIYSLRVTKYARLKTSYSLMYLQQRYAIFPQTSLRSPHVEVAESLFSRPMSKFPVAG